MCGASQGGSSINEGEVQDKVEEAYIPEPFLEMDLEPFGWNDILATLDVSVNDVTPTLFCDEEGYDMVPIRMLSVATDLEVEHEVNGEEIAIRLAKQVDEISIHDLSENEMEDRQVYYDASDEFDEKGDHTRG